MQRVQLGLKKDGVIGDDSYELRAYGDGVALSELASPP